MRLVRVFATAACLLGLTGCESANKTLAFLHSSQSETAAGNASSAPPRGPETTGSIAADAQVAAAEPLAPGDPNDDLNLGKRHYRANNFGLAERYFRRAVEKGPGDTSRDAEAWLGLAASYDRLRRFELADRAYAHAAKIPRAIPICCGAITATPGRSSWPLATSIRAIRISRTTSICWRRARGQDRPCSPDGAPRGGARSATIRGAQAGLRFAPFGLRGCREGHAATRCMAPALR